MSSIWHHNLADYASTAELEKLNYAQCQFCVQPTLRFDDSPEWWREHDDDYFLPSGVTPARLYICPSCGWWSSHYYDVDLAPSCYTLVHHQAYASLRPLDLSIPDQPLQCIKDYLAFDYSARYALHPRLCERLVGDVLSSIGYSIELTAYQKDGGIDLYLLTDGHRVGAVQIKRTRDSVGVEQVREFVGAMVLDGITRGMFVTTSRFTTPAIAAAGEAGVRGLPIELLDSQRIFDMLRLQRTPAPRSYDDWSGLYPDLRYHHLGRITRATFTD